MKHVVIFSVSYYGRAIFRSLRKDLNNYNIVCFIDNNAAAEYGGEFAKIPILSPNKLIDMEFDQVLIAGRSIQDQVQQLENDLKIPKYKILSKIFSFRPMFLIFHYFYEVAAYFLFIKNKNQLK